MNYTELEKKVLEMAKRGEKLHGYALDVLMDITLREGEERKA